MNGFIYYVGKMIENLKIVYVGSSPLKREYEVAYWGFCYGSFSESSSICEGKFEEDVEAKC